MDKIRSLVVVSAIAMILLLNKQARLRLMTSVLDRVLAIATRLATRMVIKTGIVQLLESGRVVAAKIIYL
ncbi:unnamed protein product [Arabis nemorensis]|uniref:Uncharacterized protein n=1 Tax=Arabis nemorensis TaxID=586526 RepID=A0A565C812_9BRAS|nr:unnamed protein product [Arabis nemorensis]